MKITKLEKKKRLYLLELDNNEKTYITEDTIVHFFLSKDKTITKEDYQRIKDYSQISYGKNLALYYLSFQQRTEKEVTDYLHQKELDETAIEKIIHELTSNNWIDDARYSESFIQQNFSIGNKGPFILSQKLAQKGVSQTIIQEKLNQFEFDELALKIAQKLQKQYQKKYPSKALSIKIIQNLQQKGFAIDQSKRAVQGLTFEADEEQENTLLEKEFNKQVRKYSKKYEGYDLKQRLIQVLMRKGFDYNDVKDLIDMNL